MAAFGHEQTFECIRCNNKLMGDSCCQGSVDTSALQVRQRRILASVLVINVATFFMMIVAAKISGSSSLLSGALDNLGDALTYALSFAVVGSANTVKAKVALFKGFLITGAAVAVAIQIGWRLFYMEAPIIETMSIAAIINLAANAVCLALLHRYRHSDVNMSSVWECSRNDVFEGFAVIAAVLFVWVFDSGWPDILIALALLIMFLRSASRVLLRAWGDLHPAVIAT
jgi:Co/Zn/Cd efflux system component